MESRKLYAEAFIQDSGALYDSLMNQNVLQFGKTPEIWLDEIGFKEPVSDLVETKRDEVVELFIELYSEDNNPAEDLYDDKIEEIVDRYLLTVGGDIVHGIENDFGVTLVQNERLFAPVILAEEFKGGAFSDPIAILENDMEEYFDILIFYMKLYDEYKGDFSDSDVENILDKAENEVFGYGFDDDEDTVLGRIRNMGDKAYTNLDGLIVEMDKLKDNSIEAHEEFSKEIDNINNLVRRLYHFS